MKATDDLYKQYYPLLMKMVNKVWRSCPSLERDELIGQANLIFCQAAKSYDKKKNCKFITHLSSQLKAMLNNITSEHGPSQITGVRVMWASFEEISMVESKDGIESQGQTSQCLSSSIEYSAKMADCVDSNWENRIPDFKVYFNSMDVDCRQMFNDILDSKFDPDPVSAGIMGRKTFLATVSNLTAKKMHNRRYLKYGWSVKKVQEVRDRLSSYIRQWKCDKLPCRIVKFNCNLF